MARKRISRDEMFIKICQIVAQRSTCLRSQVGAIIVKEGRIVSMGYNGPISGMAACEDLTPWNRYDIEHHRISDHKAKEIMDRACQGAGCTRSLHAETNAIAFAARAGVPVEGCTMYCTMSPCINCAKVIVNSGIAEVKYLEEYRDTAGLDLLMEAGIIIGHLEGPGWEL